MRIVIDARIISSTTGRYVERLLTSLEAIDTTNEYIVLVRRHDATYWHPTNANFHVMVADFPLHSLREQFSYAWFLRSLKPDIVHFTMPQQPLLYRGTHLTTIHDLTILRTYNSDKNWLIFHFKQIVAHLVFFVIGHTSRTIITPSDYTRRDYVQFAHISPKKAAVTYEAADSLASTPRPYDGLPPQAPYLLYVGQQSDYKNIKRLIKAHQRLLKTMPDLLLVLVGKLDKAAIKTSRWVEQQAYQNVIFTGFVDDAELAWLYANCRAYVFPSLMEGFGLPGLEAMRHGAPVVSSNATCLPEIYADAAHYFDPTDITAMANAISQVITDDTLRRSLINRGQQRVNEFSWQRMATQTHALYEQGRPTTGTAL